MKSVDESNENTTKITCPHVTNAKHSAVLYVWPHGYAGIWSCRYGFSDTHNHSDTETEEVEGWPVQGSNIIPTSTIIVCKVCKVEVSDAHGN